VAGIAELATQAETDAGADDARIVTPLKLVTYAGPLNARLTAAEADIDALQAADTALQAADTALDGRLDTAELAITDLQGRTTEAEGEIDGLLAADTALDSRLDTAEATIVTHTNDIAALQAADVTLDSRLDTAEASIVTLTGKTGQATEAVAGTAEIATQAEANAGADDARILTALKLRNLNGWIAGPLGIGGAPGANLHVTGTGTVAMVESTNATHAQFHLKNPARFWTAYVSGPDGSYNIFDQIAAANRLTINAAGEVGINGAPVSSVALSVYGAEMRMHAPGASYSRYKVSNGVRAWSMVADPSAFLLIVDDTAAVVRVQIDASGNIAFNSVNCVDPSGHLRMRQYANASRPAPASLADGTMIYVPDSPVGFLQVKHGGQYYTFSPVSAP
jgi:hypothetical protein